MAPALDWDGPGMILIDYDNVDQACRQKGVAFVVEKTVHLLGPRHLAAVSTLAVRLYGGWYHYRMKTKYCQKLAAEISCVFPRVVAVSTSLGTQKVRVSVELAYSLLVDPSRHLFHTFRPRNVPSGVQAVQASQLGCSITPCLSDELYQLIKRGSCPRTGCDKGLNDLLFLAQQKLVDTMIAVDALYLSRTGDYPLSIVSSDEDLWPAIKSSLVNGSAVCHIHPRAGASTHSSLRRCAGPNYHEYSF
jgi:hypothetical protein